MSLYRGRCHLCRRGGADTIDHVAPVAWGGSDHPANLKPAHRSCNSSKGAARPSRSCYTVPVMWIPGYGANVPGTVRVPLFPLIRWLWVLLLVCGGLGLRWLGEHFHVETLRQVGVAVVVVPLAVNALSLAAWWLSCRSATRKARSTDSMSPEDWLNGASQR